MALEGAFGIGCVFFSGGTGTLQHVIELTNMQREAFPLEYVDMLPVTKLWRSENPNVLVFNRYLLATESGNGNPLLVEYHPIRWFNGKIYRKPCAFATISMFRRCLHSTRASCIAMCAREWMKPQERTWFPLELGYEEKNTLGVDLDGTACTANELETNKSCKRLDCPPFCMNQTPRHCKRKLWGPVHRSEQAHQQIRSISYWSFIVITISIRDHQNHHI